MAYPAAILRADGTVQHVEGRRFPVGELDGQERERTLQLVALFTAAGFKSRAIPDIRSELLAEGTRRTVVLESHQCAVPCHPHRSCTFEPTRALVAEMMTEAKAIAESLGASFRHTVDERIEGARAVGHHKTSMLQDVEIGRPVELDALMLSVLELATLTGHRADAIRHVYACAALLNAGLAAAAG